MSINRTYAVFGLGRYGMAIAKELVNNGAEVLAVDVDENVVNDASVYIPFCKCADITDADVIEQLGIGNIDVVIIATANNLEASVMATMLCKEAGVKTVIAKCADEMQRKILTKVGADQVMFPESESGTRLARNLISSGFMDIIDLSDDVSMVELNVRPEWQGQSLLQLNLRKRYGINVVAVCRGENVNINIDPECPLEADMKLIVIAHTSELNKLK